MTFKSLKGRYFYALSVELFKASTQQAFLEIAILDHLAPVNHTDWSTFFQKVEPDMRVFGWKVFRSSAP